MSKFEARELEVWRSVSGKHPNILELLGAVKNDDHVIMFMEFMDGKFSSKQISFISLTSSWAEVRVCGRGGEGGKLALYCEAFKRYCRVR